MGLGGTQRVIPPAILAIVANTQVLGEVRPWASAPTDANMLSAAQSLCKQTLPIEPDPSQSTTYVFDPTIGDVAKTALIRNNGDYELWKRLCSIDNRPPLRALMSVWNGQTPAFLVRPSYDFYPTDAYPADAPVADSHAQVVLGVHDDNVSPWCLRKPLDPVRAARAAAWVADTANYSASGQPLPFCPEQVVPASDDYPATGDGHLTTDVLHAWGTRGSINAGLAVFLYLDAVARGTVAPKPPYDQCEQWNP
jgi:hypothetical protein